MTRAHPLDRAWTRPRHPSRWSAWVELAVVCTILGLVLGTGVVAGWRAAAYWHGPLDLVIVWGVPCGEAHKEVRSEQR